MYICGKEDISASPAALKLIAKSVSGSLRDAENLLQQLITYYGYQIDASKVEEVLGITTDFRVKELAEHIANKDIAAGLKTINSIVGDGLDLSQFNRALVEYLRDMLLIKSGVEESLDLTAEDLAQMKDLVQRPSLEEILQAIKLFAQIDFRFGNYSPLPLELALVESILPQDEKREGSPFEEEIRRGIKPQDVREALEPPILEHNPSLEYIYAHWDDFVDSLRGMGSSGNLDAFLRSASEPIAIEGDTLILGFYYPFHKDKIENPKYRHLVEKKLAEKFGTPNKMRCILKPRAKQPTAEDHLVKAALELGGRIINK
jgi:DNA polymerase-3 subunit gamma/tau